MSEEDALGGLLDTQKTRHRTLNVTEDAYAIITEVSKATGKSRPRVLDAFIQIGYDRFVAAAGTGNGKKVAKKAAKEVRRGR